MLYMKNINGSPSVDFHCQSILISQAFIPADNLIISGRVPIIVITFNLFIAIPPEILYLVFLH